jgi:hypothetical protein
MARTIIKLKDWYIVWSSIMDAPIACCKKDELSELMLEFFGSNQALNERVLANLRLTGSSSFIGSSADAIIACNRAGPHEKSLTRDEIYRAYCLKEQIDGWSPYSDDDHNPT